jgi:hypothetical protein
MLQAPERLYARSTLEGRASGRGARLVRVVLTSWCPAKPPSGPDGGRVVEV